jgi:uncharacterized protein YqjF (DUF2071 family)
MGKIDDILSATENRQFPLPGLPWQHYQEWHENLFLHWEADPDLVAKLLPSGLVVDILNGRTWISVIAFTVRNLRLRNLPPLPFISNFHEVNLRVYVKRDGIPGIYFLSIEAQKLLPVLFARLLFGLPYNKAKMIRTDSTYYSKTDSRYIVFDTAYSPGSPIQNKTQADLWLTERHSLYQERNRKMYRLDIHHRAWKLQTLDVWPKAISYRVNGQGWPLKLPDLTHYSPQADVLLWGQKLL